MQLFDTVTLDGIRRTQDGYLVANAKVARTGIQLYTGREVDPDNEHGLRDKAVVRVFRPEDEVFAQDAMHSYAHRPVTDDHPSEQVTADNWKQYSVGQTGGDVARDGEFVRVPLVLMDAAVIAKVEGGKRELSMGYDTQLKFQDGVTPAGEQYDAIQTSLRMNHLAVVSAARGGSHLRIGDDGKGKRSMTTRTLMVDGLSVELTDKDAQIVQRAIDGLTKQIADLMAGAGEHTKAIGAKDADLAKKDALIDELKGKILSDADLDKRVQARADLVTVAKAIAKDVKTEGLSDADIRKAVVVAKVGDAAIAGKPAAYIDARFDLLVEDARKSAGADPLAQALGDGLAPNADASKTVNDAYSQMVADLKSGKTSATAN
ncbi:DUF2213 domain-containing protein [Rhizobium sp. WW_1]|jgi:hypothetical protein|uniref:DUF2213 domain-containing protein n=1 Tax=Rhizobium sp. WW_1 TaxID=1907375 RepID=UPI000647E795|nr:DUF2213 domain-containing protein [Rhizobium sp. WW_1]RKD68981.1 hypothetical protein BJ928_104119 [Rhizobium sp. WW_1]